MILSRYPKSRYRLTVTPGIVSLPVLGDLPLLQPLPHDQ